MRQKKLRPQCALCSVRDRACVVQGGEGPSFCPTHQCQAVIEDAVKEYDKPEIRAFAKTASIQEGECYANRQVTPYVLQPVKTRVQEICEFAAKMSYRKIGIAFCGGLHAEARALTEILTAHGFDVVSVRCKVGCTPKEAIGIQDEEKIHIGEFESMCSPIVQAAILNAEATDFNVVVGLCVGHDALFFKYSKAFTTVLVAKDRVLAHNPVGALYTTGSYYAKLLAPEAKTLEAPDGNRSRRVN
jgi:uncharacterized metal-binding protein